MHAETHSSTTEIRDGRGSAARREKVKLQPLQLCAHRKGGGGELRGCNVDKEVHLRELNNNALLNYIPCQSTWFMVVDLENTFFSVPLQERCQLYSAFIHDNKQYC